MTASLPTLITQVQSVLLDNGTNYTTPTVTAAVRQALHEYNLVAPIFAGTLVPVVKNQLEYELYGGDFATILNVLGVWLQDSTGGENDTPLEFYPYPEDNRQYIRLVESQASGNLIVRYSQPNTINGLDSANLSTIPAAFDQVIVNGAAYYSICIRAVGRVETVNMNKDIPQTLRETAATFLLAFQTGKSQATRTPYPSRRNTTWDFGNF